MASAGGRIDFASARKITLATTGGACITLENGQLTVMCPGKITVKATVKRMVGGGTQNYTLPTMPRVACKSCLLNAMKQGAPGVLV